MPKHKKVIVVIDDRVDWQKTIARAIKTLGHQVQAFGDIKTTLEFIENNPFDLAVIDQRLNEADEEDTSGLELAQNIRARNDKLPILIITGYPALETIEEARKADESGHRLATRYILKDDDWMENMLEAIKEALP